MSLGVVGDRLSCDDRGLNFAGALVNSQRADIAIQGLDNVAFGDAFAAM